MTDSSSQDQWQPIETAPKEDDRGDPISIIMGFAPDEEDYSLPSREGWWHPHWGWWASSIDPDNPHSPAQPTHWMPLPNPPKQGGAQ